MYIAEVAPARIRGSLVTVNQFAIVFGALCSIIVGYFLAASGNWRAMFASAVVPVVVLLIGLIFVPESPRWLMEKGETDRARKILTRVDGARAAEDEIIEVRRSLLQESGGIRELLLPGLRRALLIAVALAIYQQFTGVSPLLFYTPVVFQQAGFHKATDAMMQTIIVNALNLGCTALALWLVDRVGRRPLLLVGTTGTAVGQLLMGTFFYLHLAGIYVVITMMVCVGFFVTSLAPLAWLIMSEIFPTRVRSTAMGAASVVLWLSAYVVAQTFPPLMAFFERRTGSSAPVFWIFAAICASCLVFCWRIVPETKRRSLEEIGGSWLKPAGVKE
jgi:SP family arabinose:H+ symporter-like MFS transporter